MPQSLASYEKLVQPARGRLAELRALTLLSVPTCPAQQLALFWIHYSALGVAMTEPVDRWISRAGYRCRELGYTALGDSLLKHASHEAGHHRMMIDDVHVLVDQWNRRWSPRLDAEQLLATPLTPGVQRYIALHEDVIASDAPFCQIAIEYEIEMLSVSHGARLMGQSRKLLPGEMLSGLSFLDSHVQLDVGHTAFNQRVIQGFIDEHPETVSVLADRGCAALEAYGQFLDECFVLAEEAGTPS